MRGLGRPRAESTAEGTRAKRACTGEAGEADQ